MEVEINRLDDFGRGIAVINNKITFVDDAYPGDIVEIEITSSFKNYDNGIIKKIIKRGNSYLDNNCPNPCGGCNLLLSDSNENKYKEELIRNTFKNHNIEKFVSGKRTNYRNKITLHYDLILGLYETKTNNIVEVETCLLVTDNINKIIKRLKKIINNKEKLEIVIKDLNGILISINGNLTQNIEELKTISDVLYINGKSILDKMYLEYNGLFIGPNSFFQVNNEITELLYKEIKDKLKTDDRVLDLYSGVGSISNYIADKVEKVLGVEISEEATFLAKKINKPNCKFLAGNVIKYLDKYNDFNKVIVDPPRAGLSKKLIDKLNKGKYENIIYVSCNIRTLKRDLEYLNNYEVEYIRGFNMFPYTYHVEILTVLKLKDLQ